MYNKKLKVKSQKSKIIEQLGQSLLEVVVVIAVGIIVISALVFATISSLRNAQFAKNQAVATKLAQEGIETVKTIRNQDNDGSVIFRYVVQNQNTQTSKFSDLWAINLADKCHNACNFILNLTALKIEGSTDNFELLNDGLFKRQVQIKDGVNGFDKEKNVTVIVRWTDFSGEHESKLTTILRQI